MNLEPGKILVVDDHDGDRQTLSERLRQDGHTVSTTASGTHGLDLMREQADRPFDLLLLDRALAWVNDYELLKQLAADPALHDLPVIIISELDQLDSAAGCLEMGAEDYVIKPFNPVLLRARIEATLEKRRLRAQTRSPEDSEKAATIAQSKFISFVAHELRTPMTSIKGYADLLKTGTLGPINEAQSRFLKTIVTNANRMATLITNLNDVARIEAGRLRVDFDSVALPDVIDKALHLLKGSIEEKEQTLTLRIPAGLPPLWADPGRLTQIVSSLVSNAHNYTPDGGQINLSAEEAPNQWDPAGAPQVAHITISDNGYGILPQEQSQIFQKFFRSEEPEIREAPGAGLGLHLAQRLVELQGGRIWFDTEPGQGTTFHFTIPLAADD